MFSLIPSRRSSARLGDGGLAPLSLVRDEFDRVFDRFFQGWPALAENFHAGWGLDVQEKDNAVMVRAEAPGFEPDDFELNITGNQLTIQAARKVETGKEGDKEREWSQTDYVRSFTLPSDVDAAKTEAQYRNGILTITLPKSEKAKGRRIAVKA